MKDQNQNKSITKIFLIGIFILAFTFLIALTISANSKVEFEGRCEINNISIEINDTGFNYLNIDEGNIDCYSKVKMPLWLLGR